MFAASGQLAGLLAAVCAQPPPTGVLICIFLLFLRSSVNLEANVVSTAPDKGGPAHGVAGFAEEAH